MSVTKTAVGTGFIYNEEVVKHFCIWIKEFSERPERTTLPYQRCQELGLIDRCVKIKSCTGTKDEAKLQHSDDLIQCLIDSAKFDEDQLKILSEKYDSIYFNKFTNFSAWIALGCTVELVDQVLKDEIQNGFALVRPPGHHAMHDEFCGYCYLNNVGVAAAHALSKGVERILIVDWDVHHGQATQYSFYEDSRVLYFSIHRYEHGQFWPNLRQSDYDYVGKGVAAGYNINVPLNQMGLGTEDYLAIFNHILMPVAYEFDPQLVLISSGYDAAIGCPEFCPQLVLISSGFDSAYGDPKGEMKVLPAAYAHFIHMLSSLAQGNVCTILEGGYCLTSLAEGVALSLRELLGDPCPNLGPLPPPSDSVTETILNVIKVQRPYWLRLRQQEFLQTPEKCIYDDVNVMPPRAEIVFATEKNRPDRYELELYISPKDEFEIMEDQLKQLKESTKLERPSKRTGACFEPSMSEFTELYNGSESNQQLAKLFPFLHKIEGVDETSKTLLDDIISGEIRNGVFIPESSNNMANKINNLITYVLDKNNIERLLLLDLSISPNKERHKMFSNDKRIVYLSIHSHVCMEMNKNNQEADFSVSLSTQVDPEIPVGDEEYFAVFHEIVLPVAYQFGPQLVMLTTSLSDNKSFAVTPKGFSHLIHLLTCLAGGKIFFIVEDGKNIDAKWDDCVASGISALLGRTLEPLKLGKIQDSAIACISAAQKMHRVNWECLKFQEKIPQVESTDE